MSVYVVLSDIHANIEAFDAVHADWDTSHIDNLVFLGDLFDRGSNPEHVYHKMRVLHNIMFPRVTWLAGNHDRAIGWLKQPGVDPEWQHHFESLAAAYQASSFEQARALHGGYVMGAAKRPGSMLLEMPGGIKVFATHGFPASNERESLTFYDYDFAPRNGRVIDYAPIRAYAENAGLWLVGHSHVPSAWMWSSGDIWQQLCPGFGRGLDGHFAMQQQLGTGTAVTLMESEIDIVPFVIGDALLILNPGSVGDPRDIVNTGSVAYAEYLRLEVSEVQLRVCFRAVPYRPS